MEIVQVSKLVRRGKRRECGLCGAKTRLTKTGCCDRWICDDMEDYVMFSFAHNSCHRNHWRYTVCGYHHDEGHGGEWQSCEKCKGDFETEMYVYRATNDYNFEKLANPPKFKPTYCKRCNIRIKLGEGGYSARGGDYFCMECSDLPRAVFTSK